MIPKTFQLGGRTWRVKRGVKSKRWYGLTQSHNCVIKLSTLNKTPEAELHTFYHELVHAVGFTMGWNLLINDETKVDAMGGLFAQAMKTATGVSAKRTKN